MFFYGIFKSFTDLKSKKLNIYLLSIFLIFFVTASKANLQLGLRYLLPVYPIVFIVAAFGFKNLINEKYGNSIAAFLALWLVGIQIFIWPNYISYFNEIIGGPSQGYKYLRDSNIDWGQDLPGLKKYMDREGIASIKLDYFGEGNPSVYGILHEEIFEEEKNLPVEDVYAVSVNNIEEYKWTKGKKPDAVIGYSIYIYDFRRK